MESVSTLPTFLICSSAFISYLDRFPGSVRIKFSNPSSSICFVPKLWAYMKFFLQTYKGDEHNFLKLEALQPHS